MPDSRQALNVVPVVVADSQVSRPLAPAYLEDLVRALGSLDLACLNRMADLLSACDESGRTVFCVGNGGSATTASHLATDLVKLTAVSDAHRRVRAIALTDSIAAMTAAANDIGFDEVFVEQVRPWLQPGDVVVGISTSGRSPNVLRLLEYARLRGAVILAITGVNGIPMQKWAAETLVIESDSVQRIEDISLVAVHLLCLMVRQRREAAVGTFLALSSVVRSQEYV